MTGSRRFALIGRASATTSTRCCLLAWRMAASSSCSWGPPIWRRRSGNWSSRSLCKSTACSGRLSTRFSWRRVSWLPCPTSRCGLLSWAVSVARRRVVVSVLAHRIPTVPGRSAGRLVLKWPRQKLERVWWRSPKWIMSSLVLTWQVSWHSEMNLTGRNLLDELDLEIDFFKL